MDRAFSPFISSPGVIILLIFFAMKAAACSLPPPRCHVLIVPFLALLHLLDADICMSKRRSFVTHCCVQRANLCNRAQVEFLSERLVGQGADKEKATE